MKRFLVLSFLIFPCITHADTETINWYVDGSTYATTTCQTGGDIILPTTPTKYGYTFQGWAFFTPVEYLESTGLQYIDTGFFPNQDTRVVVEFKAISGYYGTIFGARTAASTDTFSFLYTNLNPGNISDDYASTRTVLGSKIFNQIIVVDKNKSLTYVLNKSTGAVIYQDANTYTNFQTTVPLYLFVMNSGGVANVNESGSRLIYSAKIYDNGTLVRDFIPVLDGNNVPCMYDRVTEQYFYNQGTGNFIAGPAI